MRRSEFIGLLGDHTRLTSVSSDLIRGITDFFLPFSKITSSADLSLMYSDCLPTVTLTAALTNPRRTSLPILQGSS
jgi:hypothetical protein